jgi:hypothetical protein
VFAHQPGYSRTGSWKALLLQLYGNSGAAIAAITLLIPHFYSSQQLLLLSGSSADRVLEPVIIATDTYPEHLAHPLNGE